MRLGPQEREKGRESMRKSRPLFIAGEITGRNGEKARIIRAVPKYKPLKALFCKHDFTISGASCSEHGLRRISGEDTYTCCLDCGKILEENHSFY